MDARTALELPVPEVPDAASGVAWLRAHVARFRNGPTHRRRRELVLAELAALDPEVLRRRAAADGGHPVAVLAAAMGVPAAPADVMAVAACYQPHLPTTPEADAALTRLVAACGGAWDERTAARISVLVQACDATATLVATARARACDAEEALRAAPPVPFTRRRGELVDLADTPFGAGPHACPGRAQAMAIAQALIDRCP